MTSCTDGHQLTVAEVCQQFGGSGLMSTIELFAFALELKSFNGVDSWKAQHFIDQATQGRGARLKPEFAEMPLRELLEVIYQDITTSPETATWREPV
jgi:hypothetical protein